MLYLSNFRLQFLNPIIIFEIITLEFVKLYPKRNNFRLTTKIAFLDNFRQELEKTSVIFEINTLEFVKGLKNFGALK